MDHNDFIEQMDEEYKSWKNKRLLLLNWIDDVVFENKNLFGYRPTYILIRPHMIIREILHEIKWAYQRVVRGWDDRVVWSVDVWLSDIMPDILVKLKNDKVGVPGKFFSGMEHNENYEYTSDQHALAKERWNNELDKMIAAFVVVKKLNDLEYDYKNKEEEKLLMNIFVNGVDSFRDNFFSLWD